MSGVGSAESNSQKTLFKKQKSPGSPTLHTISSIKSNDPETPSNTKPVTFKKPVS